MPALGDAYTIERELGGGGMSRVFVATEVALKRRVVVKVLGRELAEGLSADRFAREIELAAALQDPHIVPVHATGTTGEGLPYFTMPFVEGESLRARLSRGAVPLDDALRILRDVAEALEYAHARGIVHRDIKPENILLSGRSAVVADFGIAKAVSAARAAGNPTRGATLTSVGVSLGTPAYMSPEQAVGDTTDHRTDLYAWGMVAYEVLAGAHPFAARTTTQQLMTAQLTETPRALDAVRPGLPPTLGALVVRCLAKSADERPSDAAAVLAALGGATTDLALTSGRRAPVSSARRRTLFIGGMAAVLSLGAIGVWLTSRGGASTRAAAAATATPSVAVLPFEHQGDSTDAYLTEGITDEIRGKLSRVRDLVVIARASSNEYRRTTKSPREIAEELGVRYLLTGTVRVVGSGDQRRVIVRPELVEITAQGQPQSRWQRPFDISGGDAFALQGEIAGQVVGAMEVAVTGSDRTQLVQVATRDPVAYDLYLRGRAAVDFGAAQDPVALRTALPLFEQAVARDSLLLEAWNSIVGVRAVLHRPNSPPQEVAKLRAALARVEGLDRNGAFALRAKGLEARYVLRDDTLAASLYKRAAELMPGNAGFANNAANGLAIMGDYRAAVAAYEAASRLDPRNATVARNLAIGMTRLGRLEDARLAARRAAELAPGSPNMIGAQVEIELAAGDTTAARRLVDNALRTIPVDRLLAAFAGGSGDWLIPRRQMEAFLARDPAETYDGDRASWAGQRADMAYVWGDSAGMRAWADTARRLVERELAVAPGNHSLRHSYANVLAYLGRRDDAMREVRTALAAFRGELTTQNSNRLSEQLYLSATVAAAAGDHGAALDWLNELRTMPSSYTAARLRIDPFLAPLRADARFTALLAIPERQ
jgi:serine/threonine-protein kinase